MPKYKTLTKQQQEQLADKWIDELEKAGFDFDEMIEIFKKAQQLLKLKKMSDQ
jgi:predicted Zn-dependent protease